MNKCDLSVTLGPVELQNPVITASGTCGFGEELTDYLDINQLGALTVKGLTLKPADGNPAPRIAETPAGLLNSIGLENPGLESFISDKLPVIKKFGIPVFVNIAGHSPDDFAVMADKLAPCTEIDALEVNVSCPNIAGGGMVFGTDSDLLYRVTRKVKKYYDGPVIIKLSPNVTDIVAMARAAEEGGADIISLINTLLGMAIDVEKEEPVLGNTMGGLSGPAIKPVALRMVYQVAENTELPLVGMGGIMSGTDAIEFILAGASAVGVGTATLVDPRSPLKILQEIREFLSKKDIVELTELKGRARK